MFMASRLRSVMMLALLAWCSSPAMAEVDAARFAELLKAKLALNNMTIDIAGAERSGSDVILRAVKLGSDGAAELQSVGDVVFQNVTEKGDGYVVANLTVPPFEKRAAEFAMKFRGATFVNLQLMPVQQEDSLAPWLLYDSIDLLGLEFTDGGTRVFSFGWGKFNMSPHKPAEEIGFELTLNNIYGNFAKVDRVETRERMNALGHTEVRGKVTIKGDWDPRDGRLTVPEFTSDFADVGRLNIAFEISGYTAKFAQDLQAVSQKFAGRKGPAKQAAMAGLFGQLNFHSLSVRFEDASITNTIIDYAARQSSQPRESVLAQAKQAAPGALMKFQNETLTRQVSEAVNVYLDNPKSFEVRVRPATPLNFAVLGAIGMSAPAQLVQQLGLTVVANQ